MLIYYGGGYLPQTQYQAQQWQELIIPVMVGIILLVYAGGMVRDLFFGREVKLP